MFSITKILVPRLVSPVLRAHANIRVPISTSARLLASDESLEVGPWPRTKEERERAAKKYNLIPEDYEPFDEDERWGDYPNLKAIGAFNRDPYDDFDDMVEHRFYNETYHLHADMYYWERIDPLEHEKPWPPFWLQISIVLSCATGAATLYYLLYHNRIYINHPWKQRAANIGRKYYEFRSETSEGHH